MNITDPIFLAFMELQRADYRRALPQRLAQIELLWNQVLNHESAAQALATLERCAHSLAGSDATFGFVGVGSAARELELAVTALLDTACALTAEARSDVNLAIKLLQRSLPRDAGHSGAQPPA